MRWDRLFDDLEAQLALDEARELEAEVADRTRRERALLDVHTRLLANVEAARVGLRLPGRVHRGPARRTSGRTGRSSRPRPGGPSWWRWPRSGRVTGLGPGARTPSVVARRFGAGGGAACREP